MARTAQAKADHGRLVYDDPQDDPDRLYFSRGLGRLDSDSESADGSNGGDTDDWADDFVRGPPSRVALIRFAGPLQ